MRTRPRIVLLSLVFLFAVQTPAQQTPTPTPTRDPAAIALLTRSLAVMTGGLPISDVTLQGTARRIAGSDDETGTAILKALATGEARLDFGFSSGSRSEVRANSPNGQVGKWAGPDGSRHSTAEHNLMTDSSWFFPVFTLSNLISSSAYTLKYLGQENAGGRTLEHLQISRQLATQPGDEADQLNHLTEMDILFDSKSIVPVALFFSTHPDDDANVDIPVEVRFSDFRSVGRTQLPFHIQRYLNNSLILDLQLQAAEFNTGVSSTSFAVE